MVYSHVEMDDLRVHQHGHRTPSDGIRTRVQGGQDDGYDGSPFSAQDDLIVRDPKRVVHRQRRHTQAHARGRRDQQTLAAQTLDQFHGGHARQQL